MSEQEESVSLEKVMDELEDLYSVIQKLYVKVRNNSDRLTAAGA